MVTTAALLNGQNISEVNHLIYSSMDRTLSLVVDHPLPVIGNTILEIVKGDDKVCWYNRFDLNVLIWILEKITGFPFHEQRDNSPEGRQHWLRADRPKFNNWSPKKKK